MTDGLITGYCIEDPSVEIYRLNMNVDRIDAALDGIV